MGLDEVGDGPKADNANDSGASGDALTRPMIEALDRAAAHLGEPVAQTGDGGAGDGGGGDDGGDTGPTSCSERCGADVAAGSPGCSCNTQCVAQGDCCDDMAMYCPDQVPSDDAGGDEGGDEAGDEAGDPSPGMDSCEDACGGESSGHDCHCDEHCVTNDDCCDDYEKYCGAEAAPSEPASASALSTSTQPLAAGTACLKLIDDDANVRKVLAAAGTNDATNGACLAAAQVLWTAADGTSAPVSAVVCLGAMADDYTLSAAKSYFKQKRQDLEVCANSTSADVTTAIEAAADKPGVFAAD
ncbi:MAG: hypothetical protein AAF721_40185 [Myxococcota bacterium]